MKKITLMLFTICAFAWQSNAQCPAGSQGQYPASTVTAASDDAVVGINGCNYTGEYSSVDGIVAGNTYEVAISGGAYATIENAADNSVIAHGASPVSFVAPAGVTAIFINWTDDGSPNCGETSSCFTTSIQCTSCAGTPPADNDVFSGAIPITPSAAGTGCATQPFSYTSSGTTDSGMDDTCAGTNTGLDRFFSWTATSDGLLWNDGMGGPGIAIWNAAGDMVIDCNTTNASADTILSGWTIGQDVVIQIYDFAGSTSDITFCLEEYTLPTAPDCATGPPTPADGMVDVPVGSAVTFSWVAPSSGVTPTSYDLYLGSMPDGSDFGLVGNYTETTVDLTLNNNGQTLYWRVVAKNDAAEATGCSIWSFTTVAPPAPPVNDNCATATNIVPSATATPAFITGTTAGNTASGEVTDADMSCVSATSYGSGRDTWFQVQVPLSGEINIETQVVGGSALDDTVLAVFSGSCGTLVEIGCNDDGGTGSFSLVSLTGQTPGDILLIRVHEYNPGTARGADDGEFEIAAYAADPTLGLEDVAFNGFKYFPNPVEGTLSLRAQDNIQAVSIYNMLGQEVIRSKPNTLSSEVDMSNLQAGAYFVKVRINDAVENFRVIKE